MTKKTDNSSMPEDINNLRLRPSVICSECDTEKVSYAIMGLSKSFDGATEYCRNNCNQQCSEEYCNSVKHKVIESFIGSRNKYSLSDAEYAEVMIIAYDVLMGTPAQFFDVVIENGRLNPDESFGVDTEDIINRALQIYTDEVVVPMIDLLMVKPDSGELTGFDRVLDIMINDLGCSYKEALSASVHFIHVLSDLLVSLVSMNDQNKE